MDTDARHPAGRPVAPEANRIRRRQYRLQRQQQQEQEEQRDSYRPVGRELPEKQNQAPHPAEDPRLRPPTRDQ
jgi:hypothetical protein